MRRTILLLIYLFLTFHMAFSQNKAPSEISVSFCNPIRELNITMYPLKTVINQTVDYIDSPKDTIKLNLEHMFFLRIYDFYFPEVFVTAYYNDTKEELKYSMNSEGITFVLPERTCNISIVYEYQSDEFFRSEFYGIAYFVPYLYSWNSWFFVSDDIKIERIKIDVPDSRICFTNLPYERVGENQLIIHPEKAINNEISFFMLTKEHYEHSSFTYKNVDVNMYQTYGTVIAPDSTGFIPGERNERLIKERIGLAKKTIKEVVDFFKEDTPIKISIADKYIEKSKIAWGFTFDPFEDEYSIVIDTSYWNTNSLHHELVHVFYDKGFEKVNENCNTDSSYYFIAESMVEYLSVYLKYEDSKERDDIFNDKMLRYARSKNDISSIFKLKENKMGGDGQSGSAFIVYHKTPFVIHNFAKKIGEKRFIKIVKEFYRDGLERNVAGMDTFEAIAKKNGVTDEEWNYFLKYL